MKVGDLVKPRSPWGDHRPIGVVVKFHNGYVYVAWAQKDETITVEDKEKPEEKMPEDIDVRLATMDLEPSVKSVDEIMTGKEEPVDEVKEEEPKGLMARRVQDGV